MLARLAVDRALRERYFTDPVATGTELRLDGDDCRSLAQIPRLQIEQFAASLRDNRHGQLRRAVPVTARALRRRSGELCERYINESAPRGSTADLDDPAGFVDAIRRWAAEIEPPWAADLARYELAWRQAARAGRWPMVRFFRFPVARLAIGETTEPVVCRATLAVWWRPTRRGRVRHLVITLPL